MRKLIALKKETIRRLTRAEFADVNGGVPVVYNPSDLCRTSQGLCQTAWCTTCPSLCKWGGF